MNVGAVAAVGGGGTAYALAPLAAEKAVAAQASSGPPAARAPAAIAPAAPFDNPAIARIALHASIRNAPPAPGASVLAGDSGLVIQSYAGALFALQPSLAVEPAYVTPAPVAVSPVAPILRAARVPSA